MQLVVLRRKGQTEVGSTVTYGKAAEEVQPPAPGAAGVGGARDKFCRQQRARRYDRPMGVRNFLIEGVSGTGKTSVCRELQRRGYQAINGDRELAYQGDPMTGEPTAGTKHEHHIWHVDRVAALAADRREEDLLLWRFTQLRLVPPRVRRCLRAGRGSRHAHPATRGPG